MSNPSRFARSARAALGLGVCVLAMSSPAVAREDPSVFVARADQLGEAGPGTRAVEDVLFPALASMDEPPAWFRDDPSRFIKCMPGTGDWAEAEAWVMGASQRAVLEALAECSDVSGGTKWVLGLPYTSDNLPEEWLDAGLCVSLSQDNLLATADFEYFDAFDALSDLVTLEMYRLADAGEDKSALDLGIDLAHLGRFVLERPFSDEAVYGYRMMARSFMVMRDAVYSYPEKFRDRQTLVEAAADLDNDSFKWLQLPFPTGERVAAEQLMARTIVERRSVNEPEYVRTLSALMSGDRPLRRFGQADRWREAAKLQANWFDTQKTIDRIWGDFLKRWDYIFANAEHARPSDFDQLANPSNQMVIELAEPVLRVFPARRLAFGEMSATRIALASVAWKTERFDWPPKEGTSALRPNYLKYVDNDPYNWHPRRQAYQSFGYFVPIRDDRWEETEDPHAHTVVASINPNRPYISAFEQAGGMQPFGGTLTAIENPGRGPASSQGDQLAGALKDFPEAAEFVEEIREIYDLDAKKVDVERYREYLERGQARIEGFETIMMLVAARQLDPSLSANSVNWDSVVDRMLSLVPPGMPADSSARAILTELGMDVGLAQRMFVDEMKQLMQDDRSRPVMTKILNGGMPVESDYQAMVAPTIHVLLSDSQLEMMGQMFQQLLEGALGPVIKDLVAIEVTDTVTFATEIDDSHFILYSVGADRYDNRARNVGAGGDDIIYWPPLIALYRESMTAN